MVSSPHGDWVLLNTYCFNLSNLVFVWGLLFHTSRWLVLDSLKWIHHYLCSLLETSPCLEATLQPLAWVWRSFWIKSGALVLRVSSYRQSSLSLPLVSYHLPGVLQRCVVGKGGDLMSCRTLNCGPLTLSRECSLAPLSFPASSFTTH